MSPNFHGFIKIQTKSKEKTHLSRFQFFRRSDEHQARKSIAKWLISSATWRCTTRELGKTSRWNGPCVPVRIKMTNTTSAVYQMAATSLTAVERSTKRQNQPVKQIHERASLRMARYEWWATDFRPMDSVRPHKNRSTETRRGRKTCENY